MNSSSVSVSYRAVQVQYTPLSLEVSPLGGAGESGRTSTSPPRLSVLLVLIASLSLALWVRRE
ncbi:hypothetical protein [Thermococcus stetteri]|uniref:hypothetical protein n=1 Tax=Thermococcus stetteri TaxID=49900 RepID=UPI001AE68253|nr:hypothetical protein [Thermococcus stetteri]MBP1911238.1 hypothetical protein [Thermococcus stetteri]